VEFQARAPGQRQAAEADAGDMHPTGVA